MPRNTTTHAYLTLSFPHDLKAWQDLRTEAQQRDISVQRLIKLIIVDRHLMQHGQEKGGKLNSKREEEKRHAPSTKGSHAEAETDAQTVSQNAAAAAAFWSEEV